MIDMLTDILSLASAAGAAGLALWLLVRAVMDRRRVRASGQNGALHIVSDTAVVIEAQRVIVAALLLAYAALAATLVGGSVQFHISRWLHIGVAVAMIASALYHARQRRRLIDYLEASRG